MSDDKPSTFLFADSTELSWIGKPFGKLTIRSIKKSRRGFHVWCDCQCGGEWQGQLSQVISGNTRSCGCTHLAQSLLNLPTPRSFHERFWDKVDTTGECWVWQGGRFSNDYGRIAIPQGNSTYKEGLAHRVSWAFQAGEIAPDILILHTCDNRPCVRNDDEGWYEVNGVLHKRWGHLFEGTTQLNIADKVAKGRQGASHGVESPWTKFTDDDVREIRRLNAAGVGKRKLAAQYGVGQTTIHQIVRNITWRHLL